jgi:peptidylprolyl isomerase
MIENGNYVRVHYTGTLDNGFIFDSTKGKEPFEFKIGSETILPPFEQAIKSMDIDEERDIHIEAPHAYGTYHKELLKEIPIEQINKYTEPRKGMTLHIELADGETTTARITEINENNVLLDFNHPLAGKNLNFHIHVISVTAQATQTHNTQQYSHGCNSCFQETEEE